MATVQPDEASNTQRTSPEAPLDKEIEALVSVRGLLNVDAPLYDSPATARAVQRAVEAVLSSLEQRFGLLYPTTTPPENPAHQRYQEIVDQLQQAAVRARALQSHSSVTRTQIQSLRRSLSKAVSLLGQMTVKPVSPAMPVAADEQLSYRPEEQPWYPSRLPELTRCGDEGEALRLAPLIDIVVLTVTERELLAALALLLPWPERETILVGHVATETYYFGQLGSARVALSRCEMGAVQPGSAAVATMRARSVWRPRAIVMVGIAFGSSAEKQRIGDVLVSVDITPYNPMRYGRRKTYRGRSMPADQTLINRFRNALDWRFERPDGYRCRTHFGRVLSGEELVDNAARRAELLRAFPDAIGGEMEGTGISSASGRTPWILVKGICDWADGHKGDSHQALAAAAAVSLVRHVFVDRSAFESLPKIDEYL